MTFKLLLVEDNQEDLATILDTLERYSDEHSRKFDVVAKKSIAEAVDTIDNSFDGAIIDMKLGDDPSGGNTVMQSIVEQNIRVPISVVTGTPSAVDNTIAQIDVYTKGEVQYDTILDQFWGVHASGLTRVMGARGKIEELLNQVYHKNLLPQKEAWILNGTKDARKSEAALLRHTLSHLIDIIDDDHEECFPEEFYITPPANTVLRTGGVYISGESGEAYVVVSPACDLAVRRGGEFNTCHIQLVKVESQEDALRGKTGQAATDKLRNLKRNNAGQYYHYLPKTKFFEGGFLNFRKLVSVPKGEFAEAYNQPEHQITRPFMKDIISRFSSYYARQGQPEISEI